MRTPIPINFLRVYSFEQQIFFAAFKCILSQSRCFLEPKSFHQLTQPPTTPSSGRAWSSPQTLQLRMCSQHSHVACFSSDNVYSWDHARYYKDYRVYEQLFYFVLANFKLQLTYVVFWGVACVITAYFVILFGTEFVDKPRLANKRPKETK